MLDTSFSSSTREQRSALLASVYLNNPVYALPGNRTPLLLHTGAFVVVALGVLFGDRTAWKGEARPVAA